MLDQLSYSRHRFPAIVIQNAVWLYCCFTASYRDVEGLPAQRGLALSYDTVQRWVLKFGQIHARRIRRERPRPTGRWLLDEMVVAFREKRFYLWHDVDGEGEVPNFLVQSRGHTKTAIRLKRKLLRKQGFTLSTIVTDKLRSDGSAHRALGLSVEHEQGSRKSNHGKTSHQTMRRRERNMHHFKPPASAHRFLVIRGAVHKLFNIQRQLVSLGTLRLFWGRAFENGAKSPLSLKHGLTGT